VSRTQCTIINNTRRTLRITDYRGSDWSSDNRPTVPVGATIAPGATRVVGSIGDPGRTESPHWGWIYLRDDASRTSLQLFINKRKLGVNPDIAVGYRADYSSVDAPNPLPLPGGWSSCYVDRNRDGFYVLNEVSIIPPSGTGNWMREVIADQTRLQDVCLPGTHDSATYPLSPVLAPQLYELEWLRPLYDGNATAQDLETARRILASHGLFDPLLEAALQVIRSSGQPLIRTLFTNWSQTTDQSIEQQLEDGIRWLDLRVCYAQNDFYSFHGFLGPRISDVLDQIARFCATRPGEVVFVYASHMEFSGPPRQPIDPAPIHAHFASLLEQKLGPYLVACDSGSLPQKSFGELRKPGQSTVVLLYDNGAYARYRDARRAEGRPVLLWPMDGLVAGKDGPVPPSSGTKDLDAMATDELHRTAVYRDARRAGLTPGLMQVSWTITPGTSEIVKGMIGLILKQPGVLTPAALLLEAAKFKLPPALRDVAQAANSKLSTLRLKLPCNTLSVDFHAQSTVVEQAIDQTRQGMLR
jgi:hypothetical protein